MSSSRLVRGAKTRMFAIVCLICVLGAVVFVFHGTQTKLAEVQKLVNSCNQQQESLSAQLQVIFEYKVRLEKSLSKEKEDHKQTKDTLEEKLSEEKKLREKESQESKNKYDAMVQQNKFLQTQLDDLKENEKIQVSKLNEENEELKKQLDVLKKDHKVLFQKKDEDLEHLKSEYLKQQDDINKLTRENEVLKSEVQPEASRVNHIDKENFQLKEELDKVKKQLSECEETKSKPLPKPESQPDTNVGEMPKIVYGGQKINGSTTPGLNPDAINTFEVSSTKPNKDPEVAVVKKPDELHAQPPKRPTQESVRPLPLPGQLEPGQLEIGQIPLPGGHDPLGNTLHKPNTGENQDAQLGGPPMLGGSQGEPDAAQPRLFVPAPPDNKADEEDNFIKQGEIPRLKNGENYHGGGDYEREQPDDEEDDEGEQLDYEAERNKKEQKNVLQQPVKMMVQNNHEGGVMVNPK